MILHEEVWQQPQHIVCCCHFGLVRRGGLSRLLIAGLYMFQSERGTQLFTLLLGLRWHFKNK